MTRADWLALSYLVVTISSVAIFGCSMASIALPTLAFGILVADGVFRPQSGVLVRKVTRGPSSRNEVALSFDDGPSEETTPTILDALEASGAHATFFAIGRALETHPTIAERIVREGHELANHSQTHSRLTNFFGARRMGREIARGEEVIARFVASSRRLYRPPMGLSNPALARVARRMNLRRRVVCACARHMPNARWRCDRAARAREDPRGRHRRLARRLR